MLDTHPTRFVCTVVAAVMMVTAGCSKSADLSSNAAQPGSAASNARASTLALSTAPRIVVVDMIPETLSLEANQDSEPFLAVHQGNADWMVASAFTPDPAGPTSATAPVFITQDAGATWTLNSILPSPTHDIAMAK